MIRTPPHLPPHRHTNSCVTVEPSAANPEALLERRDDAPPQAARRDEWTFVRSWLSAPLRTGAQWPSGRALAQEMARAVDPQVPGMVIELGVGTGPVTRALIAHGVAAERLLLVETNAEFCRLLRQRYPQSQLVQGDALTLPRRLRRELNAPVAAVVSSLPLMAMPPRVRLRLLHDCLRLMGPGGRFIQFTYATGSPVPLRKGLSVQAQASRRVWLNLWPAKVWTYRSSDQ